MKKIGLLILAAISLLAMSTSFNLLKADSTEENSIDTFGTFEISQDNAQISSEGNTLMSVAEAKAREEMLNIDFAGKSEEEIEGMYQQKVEMYASNDAKTVETETKKYFSGSSLTGGKGDAFRHAYWAGLMTKRYGESTSRDITTKHEDFNDNNTKVDRDMDIHNNWRGRVTYRYLKERNSSVSNSMLSSRLRVDIGRGLLRYIKNGEIYDTNK